MHYATGRLTNLFHRELKKLNGSMFRPVAGNPFTRNKRQNAADEAALERHRMERNVREETRSQGFAAQQRMETTFKAYDDQPKALGGNRAADRSKFTFRDDGDEDDSEDERIEDQLDAGLAKMSLRSKQLNMVAQDIGDDIQRHNATLDRLQEKVSQAHTVIWFMKTLLTTLHRAMLWTTM